MASLDPTIKLIFQAVDQTKDTINNINNGLNGLKNNTSTLNQAFSSFLGNAGLAAFNKAISLANAGLTAIAANIDKAAQAEIDSIVAAGSLAVAIESDLDRALVILTELNDQIGLSASALPGTTQAYKDLGSAIVGSLTPASLGTDGLPDIDKLKDLTAEISLIYGFIGETAGISQGNVIQGLQRFIAGKSVASVGELQLFEVGTGLDIINEVKSRLLEQGVADLQDLSQAARIELLADVGSMFITDELITAAGDTYDSIVEGYKTNLNAVFNFTTALGDRNGETVLDAAKEVILALDSLFTEIGTFLGLDVSDVQNVIYDGLQLLADFITGIETFFRVLRSNYLTDGTFLNNLDNIYEFFDEFGYAFGDALINAVYDIDWLRLFEIIADVVVAFIVGVHAFITGFIDGATQAAFSRMREIINTIVQTVVYTFEQIRDYVMGLYTEVKTTVQAKITEFLYSIMDIVIDAVMSTVRSAVTGFNSGLNTATIPQAQSGFNSAIPGNRSASFSQTNNINVSGSGRLASDLSTDLIRRLDTEWQSYRSGFNYNAI